MLTFEDIFVTMKESEQGQNRYNIECKRPERALSDDYIIDEDGSLAVYYKY